VTPDGFVSVQDTADDEGVRLNFVHGIYVHEARDELFVSTLFTNPDNDVSSTPMTYPGSVAVISGASTLDSPAQFTRHLRGETTRLQQPHGIWIDEGRDELYVANTFGESILVFAGASTADGDQEPSRSITHESMGRPVFVFVQPEADRLFVACMPSDPRTTEASLIIYNNVSSLNGDVPPDIRIAGMNARLSPRNPTVHNVWYDSTRQLLFAGHHTEELLVFDLSRIDLDPSTPTTHDLSPRVIELHEETDGSDRMDWNLYGFFYLADEDRMYVAVGNRPNVPGAPPHEIRVYEGLADPSSMGLIAPTRRIHWQTGDQYFPPQPLWVTRY
jgi:hypothetical protein